MKTPGGETSRGWIRPDGRPFADTLDLVSRIRQIYYPLRVDERGQDLNDTDTDPYCRVATGSLENGMLAPNNASNWTSSTAPYHVGMAKGTSFIWSDGEPYSGEARLYCFGVDHAQPLSVPRTPGRLAFLSTASFTPSAVGNSGVGNADAICQGEAKDKGLPAGTYLALLATMQEEATKRFDMTKSTWVRVDGVPWLRAASDLANGKALTALNVDVSGNYSYYSVVWTGSADPSQKSAAADQDCNDWKETTSTLGGVAGRGEYTNSLLFKEDSKSCDYKDGRVYCLEQ
jgi:hypothetical protein